MDVERHRRLQELFQEALSLAGEHRQALLDRIDEEDEELGAKLKDLLQRDSPSGAIPQSPTHSVALPSLESSTTEEMVQHLAEVAPPNDRYNLEGEFARGGMGAILRVWDKTLRRSLAMKVVLDRSGLTSGGPTPKPHPQAMARFLDEAQVTGQLDHPGVVPVHELGIDRDGGVFFTMRLVKGRNLSEIYKLVQDGREGWTQARALGVLLKACETMAYAHAKGVLHRDLKPSNIMVGKFGEVYVMDWGLAKVLGAEDRHDLRIAPQSSTAIETERSERAYDTPDSPIVTMDGTIVGTPAYMSPEQAQGRVEEHGPALDVYSIGAMLYELLTGQPPFSPPGSRLSPHTILAAILHGPPRPIEQLVRGVPSELQAICEKAMARSVGDRYASVADLGEDLRAFLEGRVVTAYETGGWAELRKWTKRNRLLSGSIGAVFLLALIGSGLWVQLAEERVNKSRLVMSLFSAQEVVELQREAQFARMWPPLPDRIPLYNAWLQRAHRLVKSLELGEDGVVGLKEQLATIRTRSRKLSDNEMIELYRDHPERPRIEALERQLGVLRRAEAVSKGEQAHQEFILDENSLPSDFDGILQMIDSLVGLNRSWFGGEAQGYALAQYALDGASTDPQLAAAYIRLSLAQFAIGYDEDAIESAREAQEIVRDFLNAKTAASLERAIQEGQRKKQIQSIGRELKSIRKSLGLRRWQFESQEDQYWHNQLEDIVALIDELADPDTGLVSGVSPERGWGIERRRDWASRVEYLSMSGPDARELWIEAIRSISESDIYNGLKLKPQLGLLPIGKDPSRGFWEFVHLQSGEPPERSADGNIKLTSESGLVFVLLPGGEFSMGASTSGSVNADPSAKEEEGPVHLVRLSPFFISKFEMTQRQWARTTGVNPSLYQGGRLQEAIAEPDLLPVENVSWSECRTVLSWMGLELPTEAQWEYAARGGTSSVWWTGNTVSSLDGTANVADRYAREQSALTWPFEDQIHDRAVFHAEVYRYEANPFGLHNVLGNVSEFCRDGYEKTFYARSPRVDPLREPSTLDVVARGGGYHSNAEGVRSANRMNFSPDHRAARLGVRPVRSIDPE